MRLLVMNPERTLLDVEVSVVELPGALGRFTVLRGHDRMLSTLTAGEVRYCLMASTVDAPRETLSISGGFAEVAEDVITVCAD